MVHEIDQQLFSAWIWPATLYFLQAAGLLGLIAVVGGYLVSAFRYGPIVAGDMTYRMASMAVRDVLATSPRRILALAWLAIQESLRRRVLVGFGVFLLILLFAGWFLDSGSNNPAKLYLSFVLTATTWLVLLVALFLSSLSLPADIKNRTIYTVVTKPVRPGEIVLGRIVGFAVIGTIMLAVMGLFSYVFVVRVLSHTHQIEATSLKPVSGGAPGQRSGRTTLVENHRHTVELDADGHGATALAQGHYHEVHARTQGDQVVYELGPPLDLLTARVPKYADSLRFRDRTGKGGERGVSVGNEWKYRSFIEGATLAAATFTFSGITPDQYPEGLPIEMTIRVFRSYKGDIEQGILGSLVIKNPKTGRASQLKTFRAKDFFIDHIDVPRDLTDPAGQPLDLFDDLTADGQLEIELQCLDDSQYFGVAKPDIYLKARDASFAVNFLKSYLAIWVQMLLVIGLGVMFSTFLSGSVAMMATLATLVMGYFKQFVVGVAQGTIEGGGPVESLVRIFRQTNVTTELEPGLSTDAIKGCDEVFMWLMTRVTGLLPDFSRFGAVDYVANGFDIPPDVILVQTVSAVGYVAAVFAVGYFFLRTREVAR